MKTSTEIDSIVSHVGYEKAVELVAKAGFDAWDFSLFDMARYDWEKKAVIETGHPLRGPGYAAFAKRLRKIGEDFGIHCNQSHAPFPSYITEIRSYFKRAIECTALAGGNICIIHPDNTAPIEKNSEYYQELLPFAKECGVKIAAENMWKWNFERDCAEAAALSHHDEFLSQIKAVNDPYLVACLDLGHAEMKGLDTSAEQMILTLGEHLQALHIHDNDLKHDSHQIPFSMSMDFEKIVKALKKINYNGYFTLEACKYLEGFSEENLERGIKDLYLSAKRLADMFDKA